MRSKGTLLIIIGYFVMHFVFTDTTAAQDGDTALSGRNLYLNYLDQIHQISFTNQNRDRIAEDGDVFTNVISQKWKIDFDKKQVWNVVTKMIGDPQKPNQMKPAPVSSETLLGSALYYSIGVKRDTNTAQSFVSYLEPTKPLWKESVGWGYLAPVFGYLQDGNQYLSISDLLLDQTEVKQSGGVTELTCETEAYRLNIRLATSSKGGMPEQISFTRTKPGENETLKSMLYTVEQSTEQSGIWLPVKYQCKVETFNQQHQLPKGVRVINGAFVVVSEENSEGEDSIDVPAATLVAEVTLTDIHLDEFSDNEFQIQAKVPNGLGVTMQDAQHLQYAWLDGKIVPKVDALKNTGGFYFKNGSGMRWLLIINGLIIVLIVGYFVLSKRRA
ncbi:hypothetical protein Pan241w_34990 [Gimesia alba]|uniref:Uncharacterized protein n=1 Tax=Gimesia alba TaxID=2527973 RepID=A0A517RHP8_9PLAN|nr:hypothetical protein [Gimesia alba]QDT43399.1 hypothetical protein Pan241w_34990 [Gimesia alba]